MFENKNIDRQDIKNLPIDGFGTFNYFAAVGMDAANLKIINSFNQNSDSLVTKEEIKPLDQLIELIFKSIEADNIVESSNKLLQSGSYLTQIIKNGIHAIQESSVCKKIEKKINDTFAEIIKSLEENRFTKLEICTSLEKARKSILDIVFSDWRVSDNLSMKIFNEYNLDTPNGLRDRECDTLVESILDAYGHDNQGTYLSDRRNVKNSSWKAGYVPQTVKDLVRYRRTAVDSGLSAEKVRPLIKQASYDIQEQIYIEQRESKLIKILDGNTTLDSLLYAATELLNKIDSNLVNDNEFKILRKIKKDYILLQPAIYFLQASEKQINELNTLKAKICDPIVDRHNGIVIIENKAAEQAREIRAEENRRQQILQNTSEAEKYAKNPDYLISQISQDQTKTKSIMKNLVSYTNDITKNNFLEHLFDLETSELIKTALLHFAHYEAELLKKLVLKNPNEKEVIDHSIAILPRLTAIALRFETTSTPDFIKQTFSTKGYPSWMMDWYNYELVKFKERSNNYPSIRNLALELLAYGRAFVKQMDMPLALKIDGGNITRGGLVDYSK